MHGDLAALAQSLRRDLATAPTLGSGWLPKEKAKLTRTGGRCRSDGTWLEFDPASAREHRCAHCGSIYREEVDYRWWIMNYQLWLAERAVHGAALAAVSFDPWAASVARSILDLFAECYLTYPNADNVLGPTRIFFSTYLESIWLLQVEIALDLLESAGEDASFGARMRERVIEPSAQLIAQFNEGDSNRQVWNNAALAAAGRVLNRPQLTEQATLGDTGLVRQLRSGLLADGTWYEGENYHLFAHRGLWYGVTIADAAGLGLPMDLVARFQEGFRTPFVTALPDLTFPARRDSQYGVSLRQWRTAESCELGLARASDDAQLNAALSELYRDDVPDGDSGRSRSTAEAERNMPRVRLTRTSLGWKALLFARADLPPLQAVTPASALLASQGYAVLRRERGRVYVALDYGHSGNGHGHPDRLNLWLVVGNQRALEDPGTGAYTSPTLPWYRSSLAHNAPFADGRSQQPVDGTLLGYGEQDGIGWIAARAMIAPGVVATRRVVVLDDCVIDDLSWVAPDDVTIDLPVHFDGHAVGAGEWRALPLSGGSLVTDGFTFVTGAMRASIVEDTVCLTSGDVRAWFGGEGVAWWRAIAPGPPGSAPRHFYLQRAHGRAGCLRSVWVWSDRVVAAGFNDDEVRIEFSGSRTVVQANRGGYLITTSDATRRADFRIEISDVAASEGVRTTPPGPRLLTSPTVIPAIASFDDASRPVAALVRHQLGEGAYRRSELSWKEAGRPSARVTLAADRTSLVIDVDVAAPHLNFALACAENPLDNEHPDTNSDGIQLYLGMPSSDASWILVPDPDGSRVRIMPREQSTATAPDVRASAALGTTGWRMRLSILRDTLPSRGTSPFTLDLIVNQMAPGRERRDGQLVLSGGRGEWTYLRGDRQDASRALPFVIVDE
jgi:hypothetical protein